MNFWDLLTGITNALQTGGGANMASNSNTNNSSNTHPPAYYAEAGTPLPPIVGNGGPQYGRSTSPGAMSREQSDKYTQYMGARGLASGGGGDPSKYYEPWMTQGGNAPGWTPQTPMPYPEVRSAADDMPKFGADDSGGGPGTGPPVGITPEGHLVDAQGNLCNKTGQSSLPTGASSIVEGRMNGTQLLQKIMQMMQQAKGDQQPGVSGAMPNYDGSATGEALGLASPGQTKTTQLGISTPDDFMKQWASLRSAMRLNDV